MMVILGYVVDSFGGGERAEREFNKEKGALTS
jgi:hypothetical protein